MPRFVKDNGPRSAPIVVIGEAPGKQENARGIPFVGSAGGVLSRFLQKAGLSRTRDCYITNTYPYQPPGNDLEAIPEAERAHWINELHDRIAALDDPHVLVPLGNYALRALTDKWGITKHRGSIYQYVDRRGRRLKVISSIHPAALFRQPTWERRCQLDWFRIAGDMKFRELRLPKREHFIMPTMGDISDFTNDATKEVFANREMTLIFDVETPIAITTQIVGHTKKGAPKLKKLRGPRYIGCIGFAYGPDFSITIPTTLSYWRSRKLLLQAWQYVALLCDLHCDKGAQNGWFDTFHLAKMGVRVRRYKWDTKGEHHALIPNDDHDLAYMASLDTRQPYWKDDAKTEDRAIPRDLEVWWRYNGVDCCVTHELDQIYRARLEAKGRMALYRNHYQAMLAPIHQMSSEGIRSDESIRRLQYVRAQASCIRLRQQLTARTGTVLYGKAGGLSPKKLKEYFYGTLALPAVMKKGAAGVSTPTTNEVAVRKLQLRYGRKDEVFRETCQWILDHRRQAKLGSFVSDKIADEDGRVRASYSFTPDSGRLSSSKNPMGTGLNLQNVDRETRGHFVPDEGHVFVEVDLSAAEDRLVKTYTHDPEIMEKARAMPWEYDPHTELAELLFPESRPITKTQRYFAKKTAHGSNYNLQGKKMAEEILKDGYVLTPEECDAFIARRFELFPAIKSVFQKNVRRTIMRDRALTNTWGRRIDFTYDRFGDDLWRRGYAFKASSEVAGIRCRWGIVPFWKTYRKSEARLRNEVHDSLLISTPPALAWEIARFLRASLERPRIYEGEQLMIPVELKLSLSWGGGMEWRKFPTKKEFEKALEIFAVETQHADVR